jgi:protein TonB
LADPSADRTANPATYFEYQVEKPARRIPVSGVPVRPASETGQARVFAQFVVDTAGVPLLKTYHTLEATSDASALALQEAMKTIRYSPAEIGGRRVRQLVLERFAF